MLLPNDIFVPLSSADREECARQGARRQGNHPVTDTDSTRLFSNKDSEHIRGYTGEFVVQRWHPAFRLDSELRRGGDGGADSLIRDIKIDVKTRSQLDWNLLVRSNKVFAAIFILVCAPDNAEGAYIRGWQTADYVRAAGLYPGRSLTLNYTNHEVLPQEMRPMAQLLSLLKLEPHLC